MHMEIKALAEGVTYEMNPAAGYPEDATAEILHMDAETVTLEITSSTGRGPDIMETYSTLELVNEDDEIMNYLNVDFIEDED